MISLSLLTEAITEKQDELIVLIVKNDSDQTYHSIFCKIKLPPGLLLLEGKNEISIDKLGPDEESKIKWKVKSVIEGTLNLQIKKITFRDTTGSPKTGEIFNLPLKIIQAPYVVESTPNPYLNKIDKSIFISYNHGDKQETDQLKHLLEKHVQNVIIDYKSNIPGDGIQSYLEQYVNNADTTILVVSAKSLQSGWVGMEVVQAFYNKKVNSKNIIGCYLDTAFLEQDFVLNSVREIDKKIRKIDELVERYAKEKIDTLDLNNEKTRLYNLRGKIGEIISFLKDSFTIDIRGEKMQANLPKLIESIASR